jgi:hypothetical protein
MTDMCEIDYQDVSTICEAPGTRLTVVPSGCTDPMVRPLAKALVDEGYVYLWDPAELVPCTCGRSHPCRHCK